MADRFTSVLKTAKAIAKAGDDAPAVNRLDMSFKDVTKRVPELTEAANMLARGELTTAQYDAMVRRLKPVTPYNFVPQPATAKDAMRALNEGKRQQFGKASEMTAGEQADLRLDIPAYKDHGVWVNSIHRKNQPTVYGSTSSVKNATMIGAPDKALKVAQGAPKAPFAVIRGDWNPMDEAAAVENAQKYLNHPEWKQVGYDPERHGFFYDRASMAPVLGAEEVIQIGPLVLAKNPKYGKLEDFPFKQGGLAHFEKGGRAGAAMSGLNAMRSILSKAEHDANLAKFLEPSKTQMRLYHGTTATEGGKGVEALRQIKPSKEGALGSGVYLTPSPNYAGQYTYKGAQNYEGGNMLPVYAQIKNPLILDGSASRDPMIEALMRLGMGEPQASRMVERAYENKGYIGKEVESRARAQGYDGLMQYDRDGQLGEVVSYSPNAIKSAIGNEGTYDMRNPNLSKRQGGLAHFDKGGKTGKGRTGAVVSGLKAVKSIVDDATNEARAAGKIEDVLQSGQAPMTSPRGTGLPLMPRSQGMYTPNVPQVDLARMPTVDKARAAGKPPKYNTRMQNLLDSRAAQKRVDELIDKGDELGMREWYGTEPLRQVWLNSGRTEDDFRNFMGQMASASQRNPVDQQNKMGSLMWHLSQTGQLPEDAFLMTNKIRRGEAPRPAGTAIELPPGYGSLAQGDIFSRGKAIHEGKIDEVLPENKKLGTFHRNLMGNLQPVTVDVNAVRGPVIAHRDPAWLTSKLTEKDELGNVTNVYKPREMLESGEMSLREAAQRPGFWEAAPSGSEYAGFEDLWQRAAKRHGMAPAEAQALGWYGSADVTALKTKPELYVDNLERLIRRTADQTGKTPNQVMQDMISGKGFLYKEGGEVSKSFDQRLKEAIGKHMADGGEVSQPAIKMPITSLRQLQTFDEGGAAYGNQPMARAAQRVRERRGIESPEKQQQFSDKVSAAVRKRLGEQYEKEKATLSTPEGRRDTAMGVVANTLGTIPDLFNLGLEGVDLLASQVPAFSRPESVMNPQGSRVAASPMASERPYGGSQQWREAFQGAGWMGDNSAPVTEFVGGILTPVAAVKAPKAIRGALNAARKP